MKLPKSLLFILALMAGGLGYADDQIDKELGREKIRTLSVIDVKAGTESIYSVSDEAAKYLPKGRHNARSPSLERAIDRVIAKGPTHVAKISRSVEAATAACGWYSGYYRSYYPSYYYPNYYYGGGFYGTGYGYGSVWDYAGSYSYPYYGGIYWGW